MIFWQNKLLKAPVSILGRLDASKDTFYSKGDNFGTNVAGVGVWFDRLTHCHIST